MFARVRKFLLFSLIFAGFCQAGAVEKPSLAFSAEWLSLLHYEKTFFGYSSKIRGNYFLAATGSHDPEAELQSSIEHMQDREKRQSVQCRYVSRREFLVRHQLLKTEELVACPRVDEWLAKIDIQQVSLIFASAYLGSAASSFGHTFLKLKRKSNTGSLDLVDYAVNFAARTADTSGALYAWYGLLGYFPGTYGLAPYHHLIKEYVSLEGRDIWEYELRLSAEEIRRLLLHLLELEGSYFDYYFADDNCSFFILRLLEVARPGLQIVRADEAFVIPLDSVKKAVRSPGLVERIQARPSKQTQFNISRQQLQPTRAILNKAPAEMTTPELEFMQLWVSLKQNDDFAKYQPLQFQLSRERAKRADVVTPLVAVSPPQDPTQSADSTRISVGVGELGQQAFQALQLRPAFKSFLSYDTSHFWSELELFTADLRFYNGEARLEKFDVLSVQNSPGSDLFFQPMTWGLEIGIQRSPGTVKTLVGDFKLTAGWGVDFESAPSVGQLALNFLASSEGVGGEARALLRLSRVQFKVMANWLHDGRDWRQKQEAFTTANLNSHLDFFAGWTRYQWSSKEEIQKIIGVGYSQIF